EWVTKDDRFRYYKKENGGLGDARNFGIEKAKGIYILPLDSDNKIRPDFAVKAISKMEISLSIGVVYGDAQYFGEKTGKWKVGEFDKYRMLEHNYIDACAIIRKSVFDIVGKYDTNLPYQGHEDWDFWLSCIENRIEFNYLEEITFDYRVTSNSMIKGFDKEMMKENILYIKKKHFSMYINAFSLIFSQLGKLTKEKEKYNKSLIFKFLKKIKIF
ncbi:MAG: glycosyltransferase, partial [Flavobacteriaceae bacterium]|nr:glycosyltransferase [Flavobacteriaceae bacterium]